MTNRLMSEGQADITAINIPTLDPYTEEQHCLSRAVSTSNSVLHKPHLDRIYIYIDHRWARVRWIARATRTFLPEARAGNISFLMTVTEKVCTQTYLVRAKMHDV